MGRLNPSRETKFSGTHGDRGMFIFPVQLTTSRIGNLTRLIHTLLYVMTIHTYIHTYCTSTYIGYALTTDTADHEQVWQPYAIDPYYSAISKWWPYLLALYINTDHQQ